MLGIKRTISETPQEMTVTVTMQTRKEGMVSAFKDDILKCDVDTPLPREKQPRTGANTRQQTATGEQQTKVRNTAKTAKMPVEPQHQMPAPLQKGNHARTMQTAPASKAKRARSGMPMTMPPSQKKSALRSVKSSHRSTEPTHTQAGAASRTATLAKAPTTTPCATCATSASSPTENTPSPMVPALTRRTIAERTSTWTEEVSKSVKHIPATSTTGIVSLNLCSGVNMSAEAMKQQSVQVRQHIDVELDPVARSIASLHHNSDTTSLPQDVLLVTEQHIRHLFEKYGIIDVVVISTPCRDLSSANASDTGLAGSESKLLWDALRIPDIV